MKSIKFCLTNRPINMGLVQGKPLVHECCLCGDTEAEQRNIDKKWYCYPKHFCTWGNTLGHQCPSLIVLSEKNVSGNTNIQYCKFHKCIVNTCHNVSANVKYKNSKYCISHTCKFNDCTLAKLEDDRFCGQCAINKCKRKCAIETCYNSEVNDLSIWWCNLHKCESPTGCTAIKVGDSHYCVDHKCSNSDCKTIATRKGGNCNVCKNL